MGLFSVSRMCKFHHSLWSVVPGTEPLYHNVFSLLWCCIELPECQTILQLIDLSLSLLPRCLPQIRGQWATRAPAETQRNRDHIRGGIFTATMTINTHPMYHPHGLYCSGCRISSILNNVLLYLLICQSLWE